MMRKMVKQKIINSPDLICKKLIALFMFMVLLFTGCRFSPDSNNKNKAEEVKTATLHINFTDITARSVLPNLVLNNFVLTGHRGNTADTELAHKASQTEMEAVTITIQTGTWEFTMTAHITSGGSSTATDFTDTIEVDVESGVETLTFDLKPIDSSGTRVTNGDFEIQVSLAQASSAERAEATLYREDETTVVGTSDSYTDTSSITFSRTNLEPGTYYVKIRYYSLNEIDNNIEQNFWDAYVRIAEGLKASAEVRDFNLNSVYHITYEGEGGRLADGETAILSYSRNSSHITLANYEKTGAHFMGWFTVPAPDFAQDPIVNLNPEVTARNMTYYALWASGEIYVDKNGTGKGYYSTSPVNSLEKAFTSINNVYTRYSSLNPNNYTPDNYTIFVKDDESTSDLTFISQAVNENDVVLHAGDIVLQGNDTSSGTDVTVSKVGNIAYNMPGTLTLRNIQTGSLTVFAERNVYLENGATVHDAVLRGNMYMKGSAVISNELTFNEGALITLTGNLTSETAATITISPDTYYANDNRILTNNDYTAANCGKFAIEPNHPDTSWKITNTGVLYEEIVQNISITHYNNELDMVVPEPVFNGTTATFTAPDGYTNYVWMVDNITPSGNSPYPGITFSSDRKTLTLNMENWTPGYYDIYLSAVKDNKKYTFHDQIERES